MDSNDYDVIDKFREFAADQGIELPQNIIADGKLHRFRIEGEDKGKLSGAYGLHLDGRPAGFVQNFKTDEKATKWKYTDPNYKKEPITPEKIKADAERKIEYARKAEAARKADIESKEQAAIRARKEWNNTKPSDYNPYAERKGIQLHNARISEYKGEQQLIIPLQDKAGNFVSLQRVQADGTKRLFKEAQKQGAFSVLNKQPAPQIIAIAEGFATTASVIEDRYSVKNNIMGVMAVDAGNLKAVAEAMRELHPNAEILIFGDKGDKDNKGEKAAVEAARAVNGYSVMPPIEKGDFNDYLTGKSGDITVSLENLINQSMRKIMAAEYYDKAQAFEAGQDAYRGVDTEYKVKDLPMALEQPHRHDNLINKEQFMLGFIENATKEDGFKSIEEAFKSRLPHLNADEYLSIALETVDRVSSENDYSNLPKLPLRDNLENPEISFEVINRADNNKLDVFNNASDAMERAVEVNAETIKIKEQGQFITEAWKNEDAEFVMPEGESFSKKYVVNSIQDAAVVEKIIEPVVMTENVQAQATPAVEQPEPVKITPEAVQEAVASNHNPVKAADEIPISPLPEPDYSAMPDYGYDDSYDAHLAAQEAQYSKPEPKPEKLQKELEETVKQPQTEIEPVTSATINPEKVDISKPDIKAINPEQKPEPLKLIPQDIADKYLQVDDKFYFRKNKDVVIFEDKGVKLETKLNSPSVAADLVRIAAERNWKEIKITGTPEFKSEVWMEAESRGITTTGYKPTDIDKAMLKERIAKNPTNTIEEVQVVEKTKTTSVRQMLDESVDKKMAEQHLQSHPKLKETFEYLEALKKQLEKNDTPAAQIKMYMDTTKEGMAQMIEAGKYPEFQKVEHRQDTRQDKQPEPQKTQAQKEIVATKIKSKDRVME